MKITYDEYGFMDYNVDTFNETRDSSMVTLIVGNLTNNTTNAQPTCPFLARSISLGSRLLLFSSWRWSSLEQQKRHILLMVTEQSITDVSGHQKRFVSAALSWELIDTGSVCLLGGLHIRSLMSRNARTEISSKGVNVHWFEESTVRFQN